MNDLIIGTGRKSSLDEVLRVSETEVVRKFGKPRGMIARGHGIEIHTSRHAFEGPFEQISVRIPSEGRLVASMREFAEHSSPDVSIVESDGNLELRLRPPAASANGEDKPSLLQQLSALLHLPEVWYVRGENFRHDRLGVESLLRAMKNFHASDIHLFPGARPVFRVDNQIRYSEHADPISADQIMGLVKEIAPERDWEAMQNEQQCSFTFHQAGLAFARVSAFIKTGVPHCTLRFLPEQIPSFEELHIPPDTLQNLANLRYGLVLVTGMTGSGKSTTVAAIIDWINRHRACHIVSIEDPIELMHVNHKSVVSQREVGRDVKTFDSALHAALRHDPDVVFIGEMRDADTIHAAIDAASTGHLVLSTFHANTASEVVGRLLSFFSPGERDLVRMRLRDSLKCVICQRLIPAKSGGRIPLLEVLLNDTQDLSEFIAAGDGPGIRLAMQQPISSSFIFEKYLMKLITQEIIDWTDALTYASNADMLKQMKLGTYVTPSLDSHRHPHGMK